MTVIGEGNPAIKIGCFLAAFELISSAFVVQCSTAHVIDVCLHSQFIEPVWHAGVIWMINTFEVNGPYYLFLKPCG